MVNLKTILVMVVIVAIATTAVEAKAYKREFRCNEESDCPSKICLNRICV